MNRNKFINMLVFPKFGRSFYHVAVSDRFLYGVGAVVAVAVLLNAVFLTKYVRAKKDAPHIKVQQADEIEVNQQLEDLNEKASEIERELERLDRTNRRIEEKTGIRLENKNDYQKQDSGGRGGASLADLSMKLSDLKDEIQKRKDTAVVTERQIDSLINQISAIPSMRPVRNVDISSQFGYRIHPVYGRWEFHEGMDLRMPKGSPIYATADGRVKFADWQSGYGMAVFIDHGNGFETRYAHACYLSVRKNNRVKKGQIIAFVGSTGTSTGNHVHYEVRYNDRLVNPSRFLEINIRDLSRL